MRLWLKIILPLVLVLFFSACLNLDSEKADSGAICMTVEALDKQLSDAFNAGHEEALSEVRPRADVELNLITLEQLNVFLKADQCDRCLSSVSGEGPELACLDRAECLLSAARLAGYDGYGVIMNFATTSHAIVAFPLKDGTLIFCEPWTDQIMPTPIVGGYYINYKNIIEKIAILR